MGFRVFKYASPLLVYFGALYSFLGSGFVVFLPLLYAWVIIPALELLLPANDGNLSAAGEELARKNRVYDWLLYIIVPLQWGALVLFLWQMQEPQPVSDMIGKTAVMGLLCGTFGINVGHELGHRSNRVERWLAKALLLTSLYMHFFIEHNKGHHKRVATPEDPSSARYGETVYAFWIRSISGSLASAAEITARDAERKGHPAFGVHNEFLQFLLIQAALLLTIGLLFGLKLLGLFCVAAVIGILLLETVNYIEHYGLQRKATGEGRYERALPAHSWNSNHVIGRVMLFELSRHSDHHYLASRRYQVLRHHEGAPQMPTGYPGMMILSLLPPAWFAVMHPRIKKMAGAGAPATIAVG
ncbi:alkane 1-monooxygenase [Flaviaesturariibacter flavus]|uniref:Alkane 1-monooxygenase n=1 Tax=Flaviaesturariibacter flavus TaxID=2502780 RepID=A0A4R1BAU7_9BACT|nr:alkane 1-monooxygenase [Flaviaesturariibacter flavus]TCJ14067.1 alkane 1-monooxygenase [Flaviaesturariibacter flavus]